LYQTCDSSGFRVGFSMSGILLSLLLQVSAARNTTCGTLVPKCDDALQTPDAQGWSGGGCLASMAETGWLRTTLLNPVMSYILEEDNTLGLFPLIVGSNSGGSMFASRYFIYTPFGSTTMWSYPCYLLSMPMSNVCYFHSDFGSISNECASDNFNTITTAVGVAFSQEMALYGGPMGVLSVFAYVYYPFLHGLPINPADKPFAKFVQKYTRLHKTYGLPSNWVVSHTLVSPIQAGVAAYDYGYDGWLSRATQSYSQGLASTVNKSYEWIVAASANTNSGIVLLPFGLVGKGWDSSTGSAPGLKLLGLLLSYTMTKRLMTQNVVLTISKTEAGFGNGAVACEKGCPVFDGTMTDNGPITPVVSAASFMTMHRPVWLSSVGATSTMVSVKFLMGMGPMGIWSGFGVNSCPFPNGNVCPVLSKIRHLVVNIMPPKATKEYYDFGNAFQVYRPESKLLAPFCGDPLTFDLFEGKCAAEGICDMWTMVVPSIFNNIKFTPETYVLVLVMAFLQATPVSARFARAYLPQEMWQLQYYSHMDDWFPNFEASAKQKGGGGFTTIAGNSLMDFMTYLSLRLVAFLIETKSDALKLSTGKAPLCHYAIYEIVNEKTHKMEDYLANLATR